MKEVMGMEDEEKRTKTVMVKLTTEEKAMLDSMVKRSGTPMSVFIRQLIYKEYRANIY